MPKPQSINQNHQPDALPNFRNMGVTLRAVLLVNGMALLIAVTGSSSWMEIAQRMADFSALLQPVLLSSLLLLFALNPLFARLTYWQGATVVPLLVGLVTLAIFHLGGELYAPLGEYGNYHAVRNTLLGCTITALLLAYFRLRAQSLSPALQTSRLQALQARIRPHFLFNSINNIYALSLENSPKTPEMILKLSELLRYMLYDCNHPFVALESEVKCITSTLELFQLKYPEPVNVRFDVKGDLKDKMIVPNLFTPLVENAFKHGDFGSNKKAFLEITCVARSSYIYFSVKNSKSPILVPNKGPGGIGIENLKRRFQINYEPSGQIKIEDEKNTFSAAMKIPLPR